MQNVGDVVNESSYRFGEFLLIPARHELWHSDRQVTVQPKVFETISYLVKHRDRTVGRDELISAVWGRVDLADNVLSQIVARARHALGDTANEQRAIRTVARVGYRWICDVEVAATEPAHAVEPLAVHPDPSYHVPLSPPPPARAWTRRGIAAAAVVLVGVAGLAGWTFMRHLEANGSTSAPPAQASLHLPADAVATWSEAQRLTKLHGAVASNNLDLANAILRALSDEDHTRPEVRYAAADIALKEGRFEEALRAFKALLFDLGEQGPPALVGQAFYGAGQAEFRRGLLDAAEPYFKLAIDVLGKAGPESRVTTGMAWTSLGRLYSMRKTFDQADHAYAQARMTLEDTGDVTALAQLESNVGVTLIARYRYGEALPRFQRAADLAARTKDANAEARARMNLVNAQLVMLQPAAALESEPRLRALRDLVGDPILAAHIDLIRTKVFIANGRLSDASLAFRAQAARPAAEDDTLAANRHLVAADLAFAQGALDAGARSVHALLDSAWNTSEDDGVMAYPLWQWLESSKAAGDTQGMVAAVSAAEAKTRAHPELPTLALYASLARAEAADARGDLDDARAEFERALSEAEAIRVPFDLLRVVAGYTQFLLRHGQDIEAGVIADRIAGWADRDYTASLVQLAVYHAVGSEAWRSALARTQALAGERKVPAALTAAPSPSAVNDARVLVASHLL